MHRLVRIVELLLVPELLAGLHHLLHGLPVDRRLQVLEQIALVVVRDQVLLSTHLVQQYVATHRQIVDAQFVRVRWRRLEVQQNVVRFVLSTRPVGRIRRVRQLLVEPVVAEVLDLPKNASVLQYVQADLLDALD